MDLIFCPCSENELESILNFLYNGTISYNEETDVAQILDNLTKIFGFSERLFSIEDCSMINNTETIENKEEFENTDANFDDISHQAN